MDSTNNGTADPLPEVREPVLEQAPPHYLVRRGGTPRKHSEVIAGTKFGRWTVLARLRGKKAECVCECGARRVVRVAAMVRGHSSSCGCLRRDVASQPRKHGESGTRLFSIWGSMLDRCTNKRSGGYHNYGGRGIEVCEAWKRYEEFRDWAKSHGYTDSLSIERIDVNGHYCPDNCTWITLREQNYNRRSTVRIAWNGETKTRVAWAIELGMDPLVLKKRLSCGWTVERAFTQSVRPRRKHERNPTCQETI